MANTYFRFRQFTVRQERTAMKVCTDACLFGAWTASEMKQETYGRILDIGAGTGLLSLMVAQAAGGIIDAVEIDEDAFEQASANFKMSPWNDRLNAHHSSILDFNPPYKYDLIISNPPFYENDLQSEDEKRNLAFHSHGLRLEELFVCVKKLLNPGGKVAFLIPYNRSNYFEEQLKNAGFFIYRKTKVKQTPEHNYFRCMYILKDSVVENYSEKEITIKAFNKYTDEFYSLTSDYYL